MMHKDEATIMEQGNQDVSNDLHLSGVILVGIMNLSKDINNSTCRVTVLNDLAQPGAVCMIQNIDGEFHVFGMDSVKWPGEVNMQVSHFL